MVDPVEAQSPEDRMVALLGAEDEPQEELQAEPADEPEADAEQEAEDSDEEPAEVRRFKLKRGEEEVEADEPEVIELAQKGYDYTKKTQALAEERKQVEERAQAIQAQEQYLASQYQLQQALIKDVAKVEALNDQIAEYEGLDWQGLSDSDPVQAQKLFFQYQQLTTKRQQAAHELNKKQGEAQAIRNQRMQQMLADGYKQLSKDIPDWNADKAKLIRESVKAFGFNDNELSNLYDPRIVRLMHDAVQYRLLQQSRSEVSKKVASKPPVVKPGGKDAKVANRSRDADIRAQLKKSGSGDLAAQLIERLL